MGRVEYTQIEVGDAQVTGLNTTLAAIAAETTAVDAENFAQEGIDKPPLEANIAAIRGFVPTGYDTLDTMALTTTWATVDFAVPIQTPGTITLLANEILRVDYEMTFDSDGAQDGIPIDGEIELRWRQRTGAGVTSVIGTTRRLFPNNTSAPAPTDAAGAPVTVGGAAARVHMRTVIEGPIELDWVEVQIRDASTNDVTVQSQVQSIRGMIYKRVELLP